MKKVAINIVLLPSKKMTDKTIEINKELLKTYENKIILGTNHNLPHISLCMGGINKIDIPKIINIIDEISKSFTHFNFEGKLKVQEVSNVQKITWVEILNKTKIQVLHKVVMKKMWNYLNYDIENQMLVNPKEIEKETISWIKHYSVLYNDPTLFNPHITVGIGETNKYKKSFGFSSSKIAIFQLGNYCTCKKFIYSTDLG